MPNNGGFKKYICCRSPMAEATDLKSVQCGFDSRWQHQTFVADIKNRESARKILVRSQGHLDIAQFGNALALGARERGFKSHCLVQSKFIKEIDNMDFKYDTVGVVMPSLSFDGTINPFPGQKVGMTVKAENVPKLNQDYISVRDKDKATFIMSNITKVEIFQDEEKFEDCTVKLTFADGSTTTATIHDGDEFNFEQGITICLIKKLLQDKLSGFGFSANTGSGVYNKLVKHCVKLYNQQIADEIEANIEAERIEKKRRKYAEKKAKRKAAREAAEREKAIEIQKEAYIRAIKALKAEQQTAQPAEGVKKKFDFRHR